MYDIYIVLNNTPGAPGLLGKTLGKSGVGLEGGGVFTTPDVGHAYFLVEDGEKARKVLTAAGYEVREVCRPLIRKLPQVRPGEPGEIADALGRSGINIRVQYSDHSNRLILLTDDNDRAAEVTRKWEIVSYESAAE